MHDRFSADFFRANRDRLRQTITESVPVIVTANGLLQRNGDTAYPFEQDADFWYLTGSDDPDLVLVLDGPRQYLIVPSRGSDREVFDGAIQTDALAEQSGISDILNEQEGWQLLGKLLKRVKRIATIIPAPPYVEQYGLYVNPAKRRLLQRIKSHNTALELLDIRQQLAAMRTIKQPEELAAIRRAIDVTIDALQEATAPAARSAYLYEYEIEAALAQGFRGRGAKGHAFEPIVAGGRRACTLHNISNNNPLSRDELVVLDVGAEVSHYAADITRTISLRKPSARQQAVYEAVRESQEYALSLLKPGVLLREYEQQVVQFIGEKLRTLKLVRKVEPSAVRQYYPHATSHFLGLDVHDAGDYGQPLTPGTVLTVEPGIYIADEGIGVRIEDDVLVTGHGVEVLSERLPRSLL